MVSALVLGLGLSGGGSGAVLRGEVSYLWYVTRMMTIVLGPDLRLGNGP